VCSNGHTHSVTCRLRVSRSSSSTLVRQWKGARRSKSRCFVEGGWSRERLLAAVVEPTLSTITTANHGHQQAFDHSGKIKIAFVLRHSMWSRNSEMTWKSGKTNLSPLLQFCKRSSTASAYAVSKRVEVAAGSVVSQRNGRCPMVQIVHARPS